MEFRIRNSTKLKIEDKKRTSPKDERSSDWILAGYGQQMKGKCSDTRWVRPTDKGKMIRDSFSATKSGSNAPEQEPS